MAIRALWNPASDVVSLREAMDRLVADSFINPRTLLATAGRGMAVAESLHETNDGFIVQLAAPGLDPEKVQITTQGNAVSIKGERPAPTFEGAQQIWGGISYGSFEHSFSLPAAVDPSGAQASYDRGILLIRLPKAQHARAHTIKISSKEQPRIEGVGVTQ